MTKSELKTGMIVKLADGKECMVFKDAHTKVKTKDFLVAIDGDTYWLDLNDYKEDMTFNYSAHARYNIMEVIEVFHPYAYIRPDYQKEKRNTIWSRHEKKKYTYAQLREILGEEFEVVG